MENGRCFPTTAPLSPLGVGIIYDRTYLGIQCSDKIVLAQITMSPSAMAKPSTWTPDFSASGSLFASLHQFFDEPASYVGGHSRVSMHHRPIVQHRLGCVQ